MADALNAWDMAKSDMKRQLTDQSFSHFKGDAAEEFERVFMLFADSRDDFPLDKCPDNWAWITMELGSLSLRRKKGSKPANLGDAVSYFSEALKVYQQESNPREWALCQRGIGKALRLLGDGKDPALKEQSLKAYGAALRSITKEGWPELWHTVHLELSMLYQDNALDTAGVDKDITLARTHYRLAFDLDGKEFPDLHETMTGLYNSYLRLRALRKELDVVQSKQDVGSGDTIP